MVVASEFSGGIAQLEDAIAEETWLPEPARTSPGPSPYNSSTPLTGDMVWTCRQRRSQREPHPGHLHIIHPRHSRSSALKRGTKISSPHPHLHRQRRTRRYRADLRAPDRKKNVSAAPNVGVLLATAPCVVTNPVGYTVTNLRPFDVPVASAVTSVGLIHLLMLSFFIVMGTFGARFAAGYETMLAIRSLICVRLLTSFITYFWIVLFYTFLSRAFQLPFDCKCVSIPRTVQYTGMLNWVDMPVWYAHLSPPHASDRSPARASSGLALEAMIMLLTACFVPFFLTLWIIANVCLDLPAPGPPAPIPLRVCRAVRQYLARGTDGRVFYYK
ncbi:hypothetical protein DFH09DRAFT_1421337 [Mycena vulgaris]|nr:hypothetical protein DFH09DRAFT_1421337 [Mycena vulgaris]